MSGPDSWSSSYQGNDHGEHSLGAGQEGQQPPAPPPPGSEPPYGDAPYGPSPYPPSPYPPNAHGPSPYPPNPYGPSSYGALPPQTANPQNPYLPVSYGYGYGAPPPKHSGAVTAMWLSLGSLTAFACLIPILLAPAGWIVGARARRAIDAAPEQWSGRTEATVGIIVGMVMTILLLIGVIGLISFIAVTSGSAGTG